MNHNMTKLLAVRLGISMTRQTNLWWYNVQATTISPVTTRSCTAALLCNGCWSLMLVVSEWYLYSLHESTCISSGTWQ